MFKIGSQSDYGLLIVSYLRDKEGYTPMSKLTRTMKLPKRYLARIASTMAKHNIIESREGKIGGYRLGKKARSMSLYEYLRIFGGEMCLVKCQNPSYSCPHRDICQHKDFFKTSLTPALLKQLKKQKLLQIFH
jgi:Rrf2 family protein